MGSTVIKDSKNTEGYEVLAELAGMYQWPAELRMTSARTDSMRVLGGAGRGWGGFANSLMRDQGQRKKKMKARVLN